MKRIIFILLGIYIIVSCNGGSTRSDDNQKKQGEILETEQVVNNLPDFIDLDVSDLNTIGFRYPLWDGILDEKGFYPLKFNYPAGSVKELKVWITRIKKGVEKELVLIKAYDDESRISQEITFSHGDESGWNYIYDNFGRLIIIEQTFNSVIVPERQLSYKYLPFNPSENKAVREAYKNNELIQVETEQIIDSKISLEINFMDNKTTEINSLYFENGNIIKYINDSGPRFRYITNFEYENETLIKMINLNSKEENMLIHDYFYNENGNISEGIIHDYRDNPPTIMRIEKAKGHDRYRNWLRLESYEYDELVYLVEREITYYEDSE